MTDVHNRARRNGAARHQDAPARALWADLPPLSDGSAAREQTADREVGRAEGAEPRTGSLTAAFLATAPVAPVTATMLTVVAYSSRLTAPAAFLEPWAAWANQAVIASAVNLLVCWVVMAVVYYALGFTAADRANADAYAELSLRRDELAARLASLCGCSAVGSDTSAAAGARRCVACGEASAHLAVVKRTLRQGGAGWFLGTGYIGLWNRLHRAEEAMIELQPPTAVRAVAQCDALRLTGANGARMPGLLGKLKTAVGEVEQPDDAALRARATVRQVRRAVNELRDDSRAGLVRHRNCLVSTMAFTGITLYTLLWLGVTAPLPADTIRAAAAFYLVGAVVGLFSRLHADARRDAVVNDYGLSTARLITAPLLSGLAAVLGVTVVAMASATQTQPPADLAGAFELISRPLNILTAAAFGLTPGLVLDRLNQPAEQLKSQLKASRASDRAKGEVSA